MRLIASHQSFLIFDQTPIIFDEVKIDNGENYNSSRGIYKVPMDGLYEFYVQIYNSEANEEAWAIFLLVDGNVVTDSAQTLVDGLARAITATSTVMLNLVEGQKSGFLRTK